MTELEKARRIIDEADREIARQFEKRMKAVENAAKYKAENALPVYDADREKQVIEKNAAYITDDAIRSYYGIFQKSVMDVSKKYQERLLSGLRVAFCGTQGAFAHIAAKRIFPYARYVELDSFEKAYNAVLNAECECCVLPVENSFAGEVGQVIDLMFSGELSVSGIYDMAVSQNLVGVKGCTVSDVKRVISHPQAISQCDGYIKVHGFEAEEAESTASAAQKAALISDKSVAAIASGETAELYGLDILEKDINESAKNTTRFAVFSRAPVSGEVENDRFILLFTVNDEVGALAKAVNIIGAHGFNMRVLRSRPVKNIPWQYYFYVEAVGNKNSEDGKRMINALSVCCESLKVAGCFNAPGVI
ncbi:MAG: chorismate mutase [Clostridia bacterium]|nr:chorismate mutase [Clostridia bacterium]